MSATKRAHLNLPQTKHVSASEPCSGRLRRNDMNEIVEGEGSELRGTTGPNLQGRRKLEGTDAPWYLSVVSVHQGCLESIMPP